MSPARSIAPGCDVHAHQHRLDADGERAVLVIRPARSGAGWRVWLERDAVVRTMSERDIRRCYPVVRGTVRDWWREVGRRSRSVNRPASRPARSR